MRLTRADIVGIAVLGATALVGLVFLPSLPDQFAIHFGMDGADSFVSTPVGLFLLPAIGIVTIVLLRSVSEMKEAGGVSGSYGFALALFLAYVQGVVLAWNLGFGVDVSLFVLPATAVFVAVSFAAKTW
ncbi:DUF1648 domain-containing protein [Halogeometricum borinquense]|uniref:DUF1648 domain-containing protein n=1 Tax=Halogeometricum borinquense TaxID=60847 RepID=A0A6C0UEM4_9EURY|nr:DUF1648 domain-containing protein [Halogeometricum borinquense]QIB73886.1 DUF1648 domain-containing protein [Halogeometricum borinquense]QIQ76750.1 DUF1648 domain-containing protein [Halogeometricum borinquense]